MVYDSVAQLFTSITIFGTGMLFGILSIVFGIMRGMTKNQKMWALIFSSFAWLFALIIPFAPWAYVLFLCGAVGMTSAFTPILSEGKNNSIYLIAIVAGLINLVLLVGTGAWDLAGTPSWETETSLIKDDIASLLGVQYTKFSDDIPDHGLEETYSNEETSWISGVINNIVFDVPSTILAIGKGLSTAITFMFMLTLAPFVISHYILNHISVTSNPMIYYLIGIYLALWNGIIVYKVIMFIIDRRGEKS